MPRRRHLYLSWLKNICEKICCSIDSNDSTLTSNPHRRGVPQGKENGVSFLLDAEVYDNALTVSDATGFVLGFPEPWDTVRMDTGGVEVEPGSHLRVGVRPTLIRAQEVIKYRLD